MEYVESGMILRLGVGIGSTSKQAVDRIGELLWQGKLHSIVGLSTSEKTHDQAISLGIPLSDLDVHPIVNLAINDTEVETPLFGDPVDPISNLLPALLVWRPPWETHSLKWPSIGEHFKAYAAIIEAIKRQIMEFFVILEREFHRLQGLCERKCKVLRHVEALGNAVSICVQGNKQEYGKNFGDEPRSYMLLLLKRKQELEMEGDAATGSGSFEFNIICRILQEAQSDTQIKLDIHK